MIESFATVGESPIAVFAIGLPDGVCGFELIVFDGFDSSLSVGVFEFVC
jgi:hypothetical protein